MSNDHEFKKVTIRAAGKAHRALVYVSGPYKGLLNVACSCPGSRNGKLAHGAKVIADGFEASTCD